MMKPVGYLTKYPDRLEGERGMLYDYVLASNGLFIEAEGKLMAGRVPVALAEVRGLAPLEPKVVMRYGRIPQRFFDLAMSSFLADTSKERYVAVTWNEGYHLVVPEQKREPGSIEYEVPDNVMLDLHSHGKIPAFFSGQGCWRDCAECKVVHCDTRDEKGFKLYGVIGKLDKTPVVQLRAGIYGYFNPIGWGDVFDGLLNGAVEIDEEKEVIVEDELPSDVGGEPGSLEGRFSWLRGHRWFRRRGSMPATGE